MKKRRETNISLMEQFELENKRIEQEKIKEEKKNTPKPYLLKRLWAGILDFIFICILFVGFEFASSLLINNSSFYTDLVKQTQELYKNSNLYQINDNNDYVEYTENDNLDEIITNYYSSDKYATSHNKLENYIKSKIDSNYFEYNENNQLVVKDTINEQEVTLFYYSEYLSAIVFFESDPKYDSLISKITVINLFKTLNSITLATAVIYLLIPMLRKEGETPAQIINKLCVVDARNMKQIKRWQILLRYIIILLFNYFFPIVLFIQNGAFIPLTIIITIGMMCITRNNLAPHDYATQSLIILKRRADEFSVLSSLKQQ